MNNAQEQFAINPSLKLSGLGFGYKHTIGKHATARTKGDVVCPSTASNFINQKDLSSRHAAEWLRLFALQWCHSQKDNALLLMLLGHSNVEL